MVTGLNSRMEEAENRISALEDKVHNIRTKGI